MVVCAGGSELKPGTPAALAVQWDYLASLLPPQLSALVPFMPYLRPIYIENVAAFCALEPPGFPTLTGLTIAAVLAGGEVGAGLVVAEALTQTLLNYLWYQICQCTGSATPAVPTAPDLPEIPVINPPAAVQPTPGSPCLSKSTRIVNMSESWPSVSLLLWGTDPVNGLLDAPLPTGATLLRGVYRNIVSGGTPDDAAYRVRFFNAAGADVGGFFPSVASGVTTTRDDVIPSTARYVFSDCSQAHVGTPTNDMQVDWTVYCGGSTPTTPSAPCCPPDPILIGILTQILNLVTLIQRQSVPFGYVLGESHATLSGHGSFAISGLLGAKVEVTALPASYGLSGSDPVEHFELGFLTFGSADGYPHSIRVEHDPQLVLPARCAAYTALAYDLSPGVEVTITEVVREP